MASLTWIIVACACFGIALIIASPIPKPRQKRQIQSQLDPLLRAVCEDPTKNGSYPHPYSCGDYIQCFNSTYTEQPCPGNMFFSRKINGCNFRRLVKCTLIDGLVEEGDGSQFGPAIPVFVEHPPLPV